jgi:hypothetical protein
MPRESLVSADIMRLPRFKSRRAGSHRSKQRPNSKVSDTVKRLIRERLIREHILPAKHVVEYAPWIIDRRDLSLPAVQQKVKAVHEGR